jgi:hypothetical protein
VKAVKARILVLLLSSIFVLVSACPAKEPVSDAAIQAAINNLRSRSPYSPESSLKVFYGTPEEATKLLIASLQPTARGHYLSDHHPQAVWIIRALRSLTGLDFKASTTATLSSDESYFLELDAHGEVEFFGTWMSRDSVWAAPKDAQIAIIKKWQEWFAAHGHTHTYVNDTNYDHWYF